MPGKHRAKGLARFPLWPLIVTAVATSLVLCGVTVVAVRTMSDAVPETGKAIPTPLGPVIEPKPRTSVSDPFKGWKPSNWTPIPKRAPTTTRLPRIEIEHQREQEAARLAAASSRAAPTRTAPAPEPPPRPTAPVRGAQTIAAFKAYALAKVGATQFGCLEPLWHKESGWNMYADNPSSSAYGIPQMLTETHDVPAAYWTDGYTQIDVGLAYIAGRYGTPCAAWSHSQSVGWY